MRFLAQLIMTALFGALLTLLLIIAIPALTGWQGWYVFWPGFFVGMAAGTQLAYWLAGFIPEPPHPPLPEEWLDDELSEAEPEAGDSLTPLPPGGAGGGSVLRDLLPPLPLPMRGEYIVLLPSRREGLGWVL